MVIWAQPYIYYSVDFTFRESGCFESANSFYGESIGVDPAKNEAQLFIFEDQLTVCGPPLA